jgi:hypothetical protein
MAVKPRSLLYWEAKRRLDLLVAYRQKIVDYYANAHWDRHSNHWDDDEPTAELRRQINEGMRDVTVATHFVGNPLTIDYTPPAITGGPAGRISLLDNIFNLPNLGVPHTALLDDFDRSIGIYRSWVGPLWRKLFNPFYWIGQGLSRIAEVPFRILDSAGFNGTRAEGSILGKLTKVVIQAGTGIGATLGILEKLDYLAPLVSAVHRLVGF